MAVLMIAGYRGHQRGLASKLIGLAGLVTSYVASMGLYRPLGDILRDQFGWPPLVAYSGAGAGVFFLVSLLFGIADGMRRRFMQKHLITLTALDRALGATLGVLIGAVYVLVALLLAFLLPPEGAVANTLQTQESKALQFARPATNYVTAAISGLILGDGDLGQVIGHTLSNPTGTSLKVQQFMNSPRLEPVMSDHELLAAVRAGDFKTVMDDARVQRLLADPAARECAKEFSGSADEEQIAATHKTLLKMVATIARLRTTAWAQEIAGDRELQDQLKKGDIVSLMRNHKLGRALAGESSTAAEDRQP
ncbi:MAG: CvpA family protein [Candidatus Riflebacteria bacterium]|nr:CvpA family protein [Candidatus Riflebacteria bacterium]